MSVDRTSTPSGAPASAGGRSSGGDLASPALLRLGRAGVVALVLAAGAAPFVLRVRPGATVQAATTEVARSDRGPHPPATSPEHQRTQAARAFAEGKRLAAAGSEPALRRAIEKWREAARLWVEAAEPGKAAQSWDEAGKTMRTLGENRGALAAFQQASELWRSSGDKAGQAGTFDNLGSVHLRLGETSEAHRLFLEALQLREAAGDPKEITDSLNNLGAVSYRLGRQREALQHFERALAICQRSGDRRAETASLMNLGSIHLELGDLSAAIDWLDQARDLARETSYREAEMRALNNLAVAEVRLGELQRAGAHYQDVLRLGRQLGDKEQIAGALYNSGRLHERLGDEERARSLYTEALDLGRQMETPRMVATASTFLAWLLEQQGETSDALELLDDALRRSREIADRDVESAVLDTLGRVYTHAGEPGRALEPLREALRLRESSRNLHYQAESRGHLGEALVALEDWSAAERQLQLALELDVQVGNREGRATRLFGLAQVARGRRDLHQAQFHVAQAVGVVESLRTELASPLLRAQFLGARAGYYELYVDVLMERARREAEPAYLAAALEATERARARGLLDALGDTRAALASRIAAPLLAQESALRRRISGKEWVRARLVESTASPAPRLGGPSQEEPRVLELEREIEGLLQQYEQVQSAMLEQSPEVSLLARPQPATLAEIQEQLLDPESVLLEYWLGERQSFLWVVTQGSLAAHELAPRAQLESRAHRFYELLSSRSRGLPSESLEQRRQRLESDDLELGAVAAELGEVLLAPAAEQLRGRRVLVVADGALQYIPFAALGVPRALRATAVDPSVVAHGPWLPLFEVAEVVSLPSASVAAKLRRATTHPEPPVARIAMFADPVFDGADPRVERPFEPGPSRGGLGSAGATAARLPDSLSRAVRDVGLTELPRLASHAFLNPQRPAFSGIVLSLVDERGRPQDGFLRVQDILQLHLDAELVVLSACQTALGREVRGEGLLGLTWGFMLAGSRGVLASLWRINDQATAELMEDFYRALLGGESPAAALRAAQQALWQQGRPADHWAAFTLLGGWQ